MNILREKFVLIFTALLISGCGDKPVEVVDIYQQELTEKELERQANARVNENGLTATGCIPDDAQCLSDNSKEASKKMENAYKN